MNTRHTTVAARLLVVPLHGAGVPFAGDGGLYASRLSFDTLEVLFDGITEDGRMRAMRRSASIPFVFALDKDGRIDHVAFSPITDASFRLLAKECLAALLVPLAGRDAAWTVRQAWPDGEFDMEYARLTGDRTGLHTRRQRSTRRGMAGDSVFADRQAIVLGADDPFAWELHLERGFVQKLQDARTRVTKSLSARRGPASGASPDSLAADLSPVMAELIAEPMFRTFTPDERRIAVARTTLGNDSWESLCARLFGGVADADDASALAAKFRALLVLWPAAADSMRAAAARCDAAQLRVLFAAASEAETGTADTLLCDLLQRAARGPDAIEDFFVTLAIRPRVARCLPGVLLALARAGHPERSYQAGLLLSSLPRRLRGTAAAEEVDTLLAALLAETESAQRRLVYLGNAGRCEDIPIIISYTLSAQEELRAEAYHALRGMSCARADSLLARGLVDDASATVRKRIAESLAVRPALPGLLDALLRTLCDPVTESALRDAVASLLLEWYPRFDAVAREAVRSTIPAVPDPHIRERIEAALRASDGDGATPR